MFPGLKVILTLVGLLAIVLGVLQALKPEVFARLENSWRTKGHYEASGRYLRTQRFRGIISALLGAAVIVFALTMMG